MKNKDQYKIFSFLIIIALLPILFTWGRVVIGGDIMIPLSGSSIEKYLYQWINTQNGVYFSINYYPLFLFYKTVEFLGLNIYQISLFLLFILNYIAGYGIYRLVKLFYKEEKYYLYLIPILFYIISPALLNGWHYMYFYALAPSFFYFIFKFIKFKSIAVSDIIYINLILFVVSLDLPNPKYLFYFFFATVIIFIFSYFLRLIKFVFFIKNFWKIFALFALLAYLIIPVSYFALHYSAETYGVHVKAGYKDVGEMMDYGSSTVGRMFRLHHNGLNLDGHDREVYLSSKIITILSYVFIVIAIASLISKKKSVKELKYDLIILILIIVYLFFAGGSNPPFGVIYKFFVAKFSLFAFLRTTAGAVFLLSVFYSISIFIFLKNIGKHRKLIVSCMMMTIFIVGYPMLNGQFFKNISASNKDVRKEHGYKIPEEYFLLKNEIDKKNIDTKVLFPKMQSSYITTSWGYFGSLFYNFIYKNNIISDEKVYGNICNHNIKLVVLDESLINKNNLFNFKAYDLNKVKTYNFLTLSSINSLDFLPHFYTPHTIITSDKEVETLPEIVSQEDYQIRSAVFFKKQNENKSEVLKNIKPLSFDGAITPVIEFKKINPTKYRIKIHGAKDRFPLVFSESFHEGWKAYLAKPSNFQFPISNDKISNDQIEEKMKEYKILDGNEEDQAVREELKGFIENGLVTDFGDGKEREIKHQKWNSDKQKEELDYIEKYKIDFISKNFQGTIQNDNLSKGNIFETWFKKSLDEQKHLMVNGYANSWVVSPQELCQDGDACIKNEDGSYDMELIVEFWPQQIFYVGVFISSATLLACLIYLVHNYERRRKKKLLEKLENEN